MQTLLMCVSERVKENVEPVLDSLCEKKKREVETPDNVPNVCPSGVFHSSNPNCPSPLDSDRW